MKKFDSNRSEFAPYGFTCELWSPTRMPRPDRHNEIELNLMISGALTYLLGGYRMKVEAGHLAVLWAAVPHQIVDFEGDAPYFVVTLPLGEFLGIGIEPTVMHRILQGELLLDSKEDLDGPIFSRWVKDLDSNDRLLHRASRLEVHARLLRFARRVMKKSAVKPTTAIASLSRADQLACYIAQNYQQPLTSQRIAEAHELHPNYAMTLFRRTFGMTITNFITEHRISHAQRLLVTSNDSILEISLASGFQSLSRFNEAFKASCGCSPRDYRRAQHQIAE